MAQFIRCIDDMNNQQDVAHDSPLDLAHADVKAALAKSLNADFIASSVPYDYPDQANIWATAAQDAGLLVWHRPSWASDEGWYGVAKDVKNDRLMDITNWIVTNGRKYPNLFKPGHIFCPKPEPQNMGIVGVNNQNNNAPWRFDSIASFNKWVRDSIAAAQAGFAQLGMKTAVGDYDPTAINIGYFGFDGYIVCGFGNADWQGKSFLEPATIQAMGNVVAADHYPPAGTTMKDFIALFKKTLPGAKLVIGEYGTTGSGDRIAQLTDVINAVKADPIVVGMNYWHLGPQGPDVALLNNDLSVNTLGLALKQMYAGITDGTPVPTPAPLPPPQAGTVLASPGWHLTGNNGSDERDVSIPAGAFDGKGSVAVSLDLHGNSFGTAQDEACVAFVQGNDWYAVNVTKYAQNGKDGVQNISVPLADFSKIGDATAKLDLSKPITNLHARFWNQGAFVVDVFSAVLLSGIVVQPPVPTPQPTPTPTPTPDPVPTPIDDVVKELEDAVSAIDEVSNDMKAVINAEQKLGQVRAYVDSAIVLTKTKIRAILNS